MSQVKLILREDIRGLGDAGDVVSVKPGYARNFLVPHGKATVASEARIQELEHHRRAIAEKVAKDLKDLRATKDRLEQLELQVAAKAGEEGKLFGSVTVIQVAELLAEKGYAVDRRKIQLGDSIKELGEHSVPVQLHRDVTATVKLIVTAEE